MTSPESITGPPPATPTVPAVGDRADARLRAELVHRHLVARVAMVRRQVEELQQPAPSAALVASVGATVGEALRALSAERARAELRSEAFERAARRRGQEIIAEAEAEARVLRAAAAWVCQARLAGPRPTPTSVSPARPLPAPLPVLAPVEARAS